MLQQQSVTPFSFFLQDDRTPLHLASLYCHVDIVGNVVQRLTKNDWKELPQMDKVSEVGQVKVKVRWDKLTFSYSILVYY